MTLKDIQRQGSQLGRIRLGEQVAAKNKKGEDVTRPAKLSTFRFTTNSRAAAERISLLYGGQVTEWVGGTERYQVTTDASELDVMVPPGERFIRQDYELWTAAGCTRRCDGETALLRSDAGEESKPCICPADGQERAVAASLGNACKPTTRLNVMLPDLPDLGVWRLDSHGFYAAVELGGKAELLQAARDAGHILPARLRLEPRERKTPGQKPRRFMVPVLEIGVTLRELATGAAMTVAQALPPAPARAITAGRSETPAAAVAASPVGAAAAGPESGTPVPPDAGVPGPDPSPAQRYADQAAAAADPGLVMELGRQARADELLGAPITVDGAQGRLGDYLTHRVNQLGGPPADDVVDAELVDEPTLDDAHAAAAAWAGE